MAVGASRGVGLYVAGEGHTCVVGRYYKPDQKVRPAIYFTGGPGDDRDFLTAAGSGSQIAPRLAEKGIPVISAAFGGANQWGNDTAQTRIGQAWAQIKSQLNPRQDKFIAIGVSKGALAMLNYARNNPANVAAIVGIVPVVNLANFYSDNATAQASIDAAYTDHAGYLAALAAHDPAQNTAAHQSQAIPTKLIYGSADPSVRPADVAAFSAAVGAQAKSVTGTDHATTAPALNAYADVLAFVRQFA